MVDKDYLKSCLYELPNGWTKRFGDDLVDDVHKILSEEASDYPDFEYFVFQVKEKYGKLRWYDSGFLSDSYHKLQEVIDKYEALSEKTCAICGEEATMYHKGWYMPLCSTHKPD